MPRRRPEAIIRLVETPAADPDRSNRLDSWKEIAAYLGRTERTARRWEQHEGLPVHRLVHHERGSVYAFKTELDAWRVARRGILQSSGTARTAGPMPRRLLAVFVGLGACVAIAAWYFALWSSQPAPTLSDPTRIVVLPFKNLGATADAYFAAGITEEITARLARVQALHVISGTSASGYSQTQKAASANTKDLDAEYLLEGSVLWNRHPTDATRIRVTAQLIRATDDVHVWAQTFDRVPEDFLDVQTEIATRVVREVRGKLAPAERQALEDQATRNVEAYRAYLEGRFYAGRPDYSQENLTHALGSYERAVQLDASFQPTLAQLALAHLHYFISGYDLSQKRRALIQRAVDELSRLDPGTVDTHLVQAAYWLHVHKDSAKALAEYAAAERRHPGSVTVLSARAGALERIGRWEEGIDVMQRALELRPQDPFLHARLALALNAVRRYPEAQHYADQSIALEPDQVLGYVMKVWGTWLWKGDLQTVRALIEELPRIHDWRVRELGFLQALYERKYDLALRELAPLGGTWMRTGILAWPVSLYEAQAWRLRGDAGRARESFERSRRLLEAEVRAAPDDPRLHLSLGIALAGLGKHTEARREADKALAIPLARVGLPGSAFVEFAALIATMAGDHSTAFEHLQALLRMPALFSVHLLRLDPRWDPLRSHPKYAALVQEGRSEASRTTASPPAAGSQAP